MAFKGITFAGQNVTPKNDGALYNAHYGDGILDGCTMTISGDDLVIASGHFIAGGRVCQVDGATSVDLSGRTLTNGYIQVVMDYDISKAEGQQWNIHTPLIESATTTFPALTQEDINESGTLYQVVLAVVQISGGNLTSVASHMTWSSVLAMNENGDALRMYYLNDGTFRIGSFNGSGSSLEGMATNTSGNTIVFANGQSVIIRPNTISDSATQVQFTASGQQIGGHPNTPRAPGGSATVTGSMTQITSLSAGIVSSGVYLVTAECDYQPTASTSVTHYPQFEIQGGIKNTFYTATTGVRHYCISGIVTGVSSIVFRGTTQTASTNATVSNISVNVVRLS